MRHYALSAILFCSVMISYQSHISATEKEDDLMSLPFTELMSMDFTVETSGREKRKLSEVPEAMWVITKEQIERSSATNLAELLRLVPGLDIVQTTPSNYEVNIRDHAAYLANAVSLLIDGRPVYAMIFRTNRFGTMPVVLEEIERIEVMLGPGSTMYGSNAMRGTINIITKNPNKRSFHVRAAMGPQWTDEYTTWTNNYLSAVWSDKINNLGYQLSSDFNFINKWNDDQYGYSLDDYENSMRTNIGTKVTYDFDEQKQVSWVNSFNYAKGDFIPFQRERFDYYALATDLQFKSQSLLIKNDNVAARLWWRSNIVDINFLFDPNFQTLATHIVENSCDLTATYRFTIADMLTTSIGVEDEIQHYNSELLIADFSYMNIFSAFIQERLNISNKFLATIGLRMENLTYQEHNRLTFIPKVSMVYLASPAHTFRISAGKSFRYPTVLEMFGNISMQGGLQLLDGNTALNNINTWAAEAGYQFNYDKKLTLKMDAFYLIHKDHIGIGPSNTGSLYQFSNYDEAYSTMGGELGLTYSPLKTLSFQVAYSLAMYDDDSFIEVSRIPRHKFYINLNANPHPRWEVDVSVYAMSSYFGIQPMTYTEVYVNPIDIVNARIAYKLTKNLKCEITGFNLVGIKWADQFNDNAIDKENASNGSSTIGRRIMLQLRYQLH